MQESDQARLVEALAFALEAHGGQQRKGVDVPYASHLLQVAGLVLEAGGDVVQAVAALLHDAVEDCDHVEVDLLRLRFGEEVAGIVEACSDVLPGDSRERKSPWGVRKTRYLAKLDAAEPRARLVAACDKLHNLRSMVSDLRAEGVETLSRFSASPARTRWYYESAHRVLREALPDAAALEFDALLAELRTFVPTSEAPEVPVGEDVADPGEAP